MTTHASEAHDRSPVPAIRGAAWRRLGSILAILPLGVWVFWHVLSQLAVFGGETTEDQAAHWQHSVTEHSSLAASVLTSVVIWTPLLIHLFWGLGKMRRASVNVGRYPWLGNWQYVMQRLSALGLLFFIPAHIWLARLKPGIDSQWTHGELFSDIAHEMRFNGPTLPVYVLGVLGAAFHLGNGLFNAGMTWGYMATERARRRMFVIAMSVFLITLAAGWAAVGGIWAAGANYPNDTDQGRAPTPAHVDSVATR